MKTHEDIVFIAMGPQHRHGVMDIFNYYIMESFAAYPDQRVPDAFFDRLLSVAGVHPHLVARTSALEVAGFAMLRPHQIAPTFAHTAELTIFLHHQSTGKGLGPRLLAELEERGRAMGITTLLASVSELNEPSLKFHLAQGFVQVGRFQGVGRKFGRSFDEIWLQKQL